MRTTCSLYGAVGAAIRVTILVVLIAGLMSGTSCDGMSAALVRCRAGGVRPRLLAWANQAYAAHERRLLLGVASGAPARIGDVAKARTLIASAGIRSLAAACRKARTAPNRLQVVGSHGQTVYHGPNDRPLGSTLQLDDPARLAETLRVTMVSDFRSRDVAAGGQGAPLAPWAHWKMFTDGREDRLILNLGGIANVTWLPARGRAADVRAFDTGPANMLSDLLTGGMDRDGRLAAAGVPDERVLRRLLAHPYFRRRPPKSTGREQFGALLRPAFRGLAKADAVATAVELTARSVADQINRWLPTRSRTAVIYASGGGANNPVLMRRLGFHLQPRLLRRLSDLGWPDQAVEPACFALLALARLRGEPNCLPAVTGARRAVCAGSITPGAPA